MAEKNVGPHLLYSGIRVRDLKRSMRFYRALGLRPSMKGTMVHGGKWVWMRDPKTRAVLELNWYPPRSAYFEKWREGVEMDHVGWTVRDIEPVIKKLKRLGSEVKADFVHGNVRLTFLTDPDGIWLEFLSWTERGQKLRGGAPALLEGLPPGAERERERMRRQLVRGKTVSRL